MHLRIVCLAWLCALVGVESCYAQAPNAPVNLEQSEDPARAKSFFHQISQNFPGWDADHDTALSANEIELAVHDPQVKGDAAAAIASLRRAVRMTDGLAPLTLADLAKRLKEKSTKERPQPAFVAMYDAARKIIADTPRDLFVGDAPKLETLGQGKLGDCFLLVSLGTCAYRDPARLKSVFQPAGEGKVSVKFGGRAAFELDAPTDAEIALGARTEKTGVWANMYEVSVGGIMLARSKSGKHVAPLGLIGVGGSPHVPLEILTGHQVRRHGCEDYREPRDEQGASQADLKPLRDDLKAAFAAKRLIVGGCGPIGKQTIVKGLYYNHSYGVLEYDETTDTVLFWNPFGNTFTPQGPAGLEFGYPTKDGKFRVPLKEAVMWFGSFSIETDKPAEIVK